MNHKISNIFIFICLLALTGCSVLNEDGYPKEFEKSRDVYFEGRRVKEFKDFNENKMTARYFGYEKDGRLFCFGVADAVFTFENGKAIMLEDLDGGTIAQGEWKNDMRWEGSFYNPTNGMIEYYDKGKLSKSESLGDVMKRNDEQKTASEAKAK